MSNPRPAALRPAGRFAVSEAGLGTLYALAIPASGLSVIRGVHAALVVFSTAAGPVFPGLLPG